MTFLQLIIKLYVVNLLMVSISNALYNVINKSSDSNHLVIFNIDDSTKLEYTSSSYKQSFDQDSINYCNFDPLALTKKIELFDQIEREKPDFFVNVFSKTYSFNLTSEIRVRINFMNQQADSNQLWYLLVAKNACTNSVVGSWRLVQSATTDTIYCYSRDDTVFGHRNNRQDTTFEQIWIPNNITENVYFVIAVFTDETYSAINPTYFLLSSPVFRFEKSEIDSPCPNLISQLTSLKNSSKNYPKTKAKIETTTIFSTKTSEFSTSTEPNYQNLTTISATSRSTNISTSLALTIKALNQKTEIKDSNKKSNFKMNNLRAKMDFNSSQSILVSLNGRAKLCSKQLSDKLKEENLKLKLEEIYSDIENFDRVEILKIENIKCPLQKAKRYIKNQPIDQNKLNFYIQHYILFNSPVQNSVKFTALNQLRNYLTSTNFDEDVEFIDGYISNENGTQVRLENSCLFYENLDICQNNGVCVVMPNGLPTCSCVYIDETHFWTGEFCTIKSERSYDPDKIKLIASVTVLGGFVILSLLVLLIIALCQRKCKNKSKKYPSVLLSSSASSYLSSSTESNNFTKQKLNQSYQKEPSFSCENSQSYTKLGYESTEYMSVVGSCGQITPPPAMLTEATIDLRYCFSARNSVGNDRSSSSASSTEIYSDLEEKRLIKPKGLVCLTDGSSTSYKLVKDRHFFQSNQVYKYPVNQSAFLLKQNSDSSNITYNPSSNDTSIISNLNQTSSTSRSNSQADEQIVNKLAYPREITIFSTPLKTKFKTKANIKSKNISKNANADHLNKSHVNHAYNMSMNDEPFYLNGHKSELKDKNAKKETKVSANIRRESSQLLPQSIEKHLVKNLQNFSVDAVSTVCSSSEYNYDNNHYLNSKEYQSVNDYNLKDEDAWLPILVLAEEQIRKYEAEKIHDINLTESYMF